MHVTMSCGSKPRGWLYLAIAATAAIWIAGWFAGFHPTVTAAQVQGTKRVLLLTHNLYYTHPYVTALEDVLAEWGRTAGFTVTSLEGYKQTLSCTSQKPCDPSVVDLSMVTRKYLSQFDGIVASTNGELPFSDEAKQALADFVQKDGKGIVFLHNAALTLYTWAPWGKMLGAYMGSTARIFDPSNAAQRPAVMRIEDCNHPATRHLSEHWTLHDEFYQFATTVGELGPTKYPAPIAFSRDNVRVLISFDLERTDFEGVQGWEQGADSPQVWYQNIGKGRTFYSAIGHREDLWRSDTVYRQFVTGAIRWALGLEK